MSPGEGHGTGCAQAGDRGGFDSRTSHYQTLPVRERLVEVAAM